MPIETPSQHPLSTFPSGSRVRKLTAIPGFDFAWNRIGTVHREIVDNRMCLGVAWDGSNRIYEYPEDFLFAAAEPKLRPPATDASLQQQSAPSPDRSTKKEVS